MSYLSPWQCFRTTLHQCCTNPSCALFFLVAALFYMLYYCWPYTAQLPEHLSAIVIDEDNSPLSRSLVMALAAGPDFKIVEVASSREKGITALKKGKVATGIVIPENFETDIMTAQPTALTMATNGAFLVMAKTSLEGATAILENITKTAMAERLAQLGVPRGALLNNSLKAPPYILVQMYNTIAGYLNFAVPIVFIVIFQTLMVCGMGMLINGWYSQPELPAQLELALGNPVYSLALVLPVSCICGFWCIAIEGAGFGLQGINSFCNIPSTLLASVFFSWAVASLGLMLALLFQKARYILQTMVTSSIPCVFISGNLYPWQDMPVPVRVFSWFLPSTPGVDCMLRSSQAGATPSEIYPYLAHLLFLAVFYFTIACLAGKFQKQQKVREVQDHRQ